MVKGGSPLEDEVRQKFFYGNGSKTVKKKRRRTTKVINKGRTIYAGNRRIDRCHYFRDLQLAPRLSTIKTKEKDIIHGGSDVNAHLRAYFRVGMGFSRRQQRVSDATHGWNRGAGDQRDTRLRDGGKRDKGCRTTLDGVVGSQQDHPGDPYESAPSLFVAACFPRTKLSLLRERLHAAETATHDASDWSPIESTE